MEYEYCLLGYQNKCTTEWGLLSFIHMQSQSNEHPLHNPSRTWPSLKALQQCGLFYPTTALKEPLFSAELGLSDLHQTFASLRHVMCTSLGAITYDYSFAWQGVKRALKLSLPEQLTDLLTETNLWLPGYDLNHDIISFRLAFCSLCAGRTVLRQWSRLPLEWRWGDANVWCVIYGRWCIHQCLHVFWNSLYKQMGQKEYCIKAQIIFLKCNPLTNKHKRVWYSLPLIQPCAISNDDALVINSSVSCKPF